MLEDRIESIKNRIKDATPGPWKRGIDDKYRNVYTPHSWLLAKTANGFDGMFIAYAREDIPYLVARLEEAEAENQRLRKVLDAIREACCDAY